MRTLAVKKSTNGDVHRRLVLFDDGHIEEQSRIDPRAEEWAFVGSWESLDVIEASCAFKQVEELQEEIDDLVQQVDNLRLEVARVDKLAKENKDLKDLRTVYDSRMTDMRQCVEDRDRKLAVLKELLHTTLDKFIESA